MDYLLGWIWHDGEEFWIRRPSGAQGSSAGRDQAGGGTREMQQRYAWAACQPCGKRGTLGRAWATPGRESGPALRERMRRAESLQKLKAAMLSPVCGCVKLIDTAAIPFAKEKRSESEVQTCTGRSQEPCRCGTRSLEGETGWRAPSQRLTRGGWPALQVRAPSRWGVDPSFRKMGDQDAQPLSRRASSGHEARPEERQCGFNFGGARIHPRATGLSVPANK